MNQKEQVQYGFIFECSSCDKKHAILFELDGDGHMSNVMSRGLEPNETIADVKADVAQMLKDEGCIVTHISVSETKQSIH